MLPDQTKETQRWRRKRKNQFWKQNARLSLANAADEQKTMPFRKIMLQAGSSNYRPPIEKGKSAPKLKVIEEVIYEEEEDDLLEEDDVDGEQEDMYQIKVITIYTMTRVLFMWLELSSRTKKSCQ